ncbi:hypothetical protein [Alkalihalobacillus sp. CinArs1]|uniref:hypothetical protein n=1 Tax=Alkalihalobacillus sp. CinArs1 TaxID=2995314 RepID=UPI0022DE12A7|nr:hypothetical protein [Alkalihalobacillus sp. CinArs1]
MYYFIYTGDVISHQIKNTLISQLISFAKKLEQPHTYNEEKNSLTLPTFFISIRENQIFSYSKYDFNDGCAVTDLVIGYLLEHLGSVYTRIEP